MPPSALVLAFTVGHPWNWIASAFILCALFFCIASVIVYYEDRSKVSNDD